MLAVLEFMERNQAVGAIAFVALCATIASITHSICTIFRKGN